MKVLMLTDDEAGTLVLMIARDPLGHVGTQERLVEKIRVQLDDPLLGAAGERTILIRQGTPPLLMANFDHPEDAEATWLAMASTEDRIAFGADIIDEEIVWPA